MSNTGGPRRSPRVSEAMPAWATGRRNYRPRRSRIRWQTWLVVLMLAVGLGLYAALPEAPLELGRRPLVGPVEHVADGDTIEIAGQRIRLAGLDAPERDQTCAMADGTPWSCGRIAADRMRELTRGATLSCRGEDHDRYGRLLATCSDGGIDIAEALVRDGLAVASGRYLAAQAVARGARRGIWQGDFDRPADWRARKASGDAEAAGNPSRFERFVAWLLGLFAN